MKKEEFQQLVETARNADLVQYFQSSGYAVEKKGSNFYINDFPGLCIKPDTRQCIINVLTVCSCTVPSSTETLISVIAK